MWAITKMFEGYFFFGRAYPGIVSVVVAGVFMLFVAHAALALRKFPINYRQYRVYRDHMGMMRHEDTTLWWWQVVTGFAMFFLASVHLYQMLMHPGADRPVRVGRPGLERPLVAAVPGAAVRGRTARRHRPVPAGRQVGLVRRQRRQRQPPRLKRLKWALTAFFIVLGLATLARLHQDRLSRTRTASASATCRPGSATRRRPRPRSPCLPRGAPNEDRLHRRAGDRRRARRPAPGDRRASAAATTRSSSRSCRQALAQQGRAGRHAGQPRQRHQGPGRQRGRALRGHGARQRLGRRPGGRAHVRQHRAQGGARAGGLGRALEPRAQGRPRRSSSTARRSRSPSATRRTA